MRTVVLIIGLICLTITNSFGQGSMPKNLKQTVKFLDEDCPDSLKNIIKATENKDLKNLSYPWGNSKYKTIFNWLDNEKSGIYKYLKVKGIDNFKIEVILENYKKYLLNEPIDEASLLKPYLEIEKKWKIESENRTTIDTLRGIYIPKDLEDCFTQINSFWNDSTKIKVKNWSEEEFSANAHFGFGMWMRNNWQLWGGSRLSKFFNELGIYHPDDMSGIVLNSYHRHLNDKEIRLEEQVKYYQEYWEKAKTNEIKRKQEEFSEYKIGDTLEFNYNRGFVSKEQEDKYDDDICIAKGIITERNETDFLIKVKVIETCDRKGIIYYDNDGYRIYDPKTKKWTDPPKRIIKKMKANKEQWFEYKDWKQLKNEKRR